MIPHCPCVWFGLGWEASSSRNHNWSGKYCTNTCHTWTIYYLWIHLQLNGLSLSQVMGEHSINDKSKATPPPLPPPRSPKEQPDDKPETLVTIPQPLRHFTSPSWHNWSCVLSLIFNQDAESLLKWWKVVKRESENQFETCHVWCSLLCLVTVLFSLTMMMTKLFRWCCFFSWR